MAEFGDVYQKIENTKHEVELVVESAGTIAELLEELAVSVASLGFHARQRLTVEGIDKHGTRHSKTYEGENGQ